MQYVAMTKITLDALETVPGGLYEIDEPSRLGKTFDTCRNCWQYGIIRRIARVDDETKLPFGTEVAKFRADGKRLVVGEELAAPLNVKLTLTMADRRVQTLIGPMHCWEDEVHSLVKQCRDRLTDADNGPLKFTFKAELADPEDAVWLNNAVFPAIGLLATAADVRQPWFGRTLFFPAIEAVIDVVMLCADHSGIDRHVRAQEGGPK